MKIKELKTKKEKELKKMLDSFRSKQRVLRFDLSAGKVKDIREIRETKKTIARILTILKEKELWQKNN